MHDSTESRVNGIWGGGGGGTCSAAIVSVAAKEACRASLPRRTTRTGMGGWRRAASSASRLRTASVFSGAPARRAACSSRPLTISQNLRQWAL